MNFIKLIKIRININNSNNYLNLNLNNFKIKHSLYMIIMKLIGMILINLIVIK